MELSSWGRFPVVNAEIMAASSVTQILESLKHGFTGITRGMGRSYGDSALAPYIIDITALNDILDLDAEQGIVRCMAGIQLGVLLNFCVSKGWFLPVVPGTKYVSLGGAIASDVHGKNHHVHGTFTEYVNNIKLLMPDGEVVDCSREHNSELFYATNGGMGLTGIILEATLSLTPVNSSYMEVTTLKAGSLAEILEYFNAYNNFTYSVAWIDCLATGKSMGRSLLMLGEHAKDGDWRRSYSLPLSIPVDMPEFILSPFTVAIFNRLYYHRVWQQKTVKRIHYEPFFFPLDRIGNWNKLYGKSGFLQYQFVLPQEAGLAGMSILLERIAASRRGSFLAVLKAFGRKNRNLFSFPMSGYTLSLDFRVNPDTLRLLNELDAVVLDHGGRLYLAKDARMSKEMFRRGYPEWSDFCEIRSRYQADLCFNSMQSLRLGL